jgi:hypothetical protein
VTAITFFLPQVSQFSTDTFQCIYERFLFHI